MDSDEEDYVFIGTPIEREEDLTSRKKKSVAEAAGNLRAVAPWQQEVRDAEGRRRFHGAWTGGFQAGHENTVGSKEGWTPATFVSSRKNRAEKKEQSIHQYLDEDEKAEMEGKSLGTSALFDTFGFTAAEIARKNAEKEQQKRPSAIPGPVPDELVLPASNSIGVKLLLKMGWRHGHSVKESRTNLSHDTRREARKAFLALSSNNAANPADTQFDTNDFDHEGFIEQSSVDVVTASKSTPVFVLNPKQDMHGLGYDPFKHAPEFRDSKRLRLSSNGEFRAKGAFQKKEELFASKSGKVAPGFGIGALEELDVEDEDIYASGYELAETYVQDIEEPSTIKKELKLIKSRGEEGVLPGFKVASKSDFQLERFTPPIIPGDFKPQHQFPTSPEIEDKHAGPSPPEVSHPDDKNLKLLIDGFASLVTRCGKLFENLSREKNKTNPLFSFLSGGTGHDYYARRLWEEQQKHNDQTKQYLGTGTIPSVKKMTAETRGRVLGERPLERSYMDSNSSGAPADAVQLQFNLSDTFTKPASLSDSSEAVKPFKNDPAKQERFEQFLKEKYQGGLRSTDSGGNSKMSESARARERLDFEAAAEVIMKGKHSPSDAVYSSKLLHEISASANLQFTSGGSEEAEISKTEEKIVSGLYPKREEYQWRPLPILCKRFDIPDPYMGKPPPLPRARSRIDSLIFTSDFVKATKSENTVAASRESLPSQTAAEVTDEVIDSESGTETNANNVERPVDLYKAIFSDDSDDEKEGSTLNLMQDPEKTTEVANTTLNRLIAGDFLESLGKELGLELPPETPVVKDKISTASQTETLERSTSKIPSESDKIAIHTSDGTLKDKAVLNCSSSVPDITPRGGSSSNPLDLGIRQHESTATGNIEQVYEKAEVRQKVAEVDNIKKKPKHDRSRSRSLSSDDSRRRKHSRRHRRRSFSPSSEDERTRVSYRRRQSKNSVSDTDSDDQRSRSKSKRRRHSKNYRDIREDSSSRSHPRGSGRDDSEDRKFSKRSGDRKRDSVSYREMGRKYH